MPLLFIVTLNQPLYVLPLPFLVALKFFWGVRWNSVVEHVLSMSMKKKGIITTLILSKEHCLPQNLCSLRTVVDNPFFSLVVHAA